MSRLLGRNASKDKEYDVMAKVVIIGNSAVGKTNLMLRFVDQNYSTSHTPTIGVDFRSRVIEVSQKNSNAKGNTKMKMQLWDTAGQERFRNLTDTYFKGACGVVVVYAVDDRKSFEDVTNWMIQLEESGEDGVCRMLVGNKCDLSGNRAVSVEQGRMLADQFKCPFMEVSAKENVNVDTMFGQLASAILRQLNAQPQKTEDPPANIPIVVHPSKERECCA